MKPPGKKNKIIRSIAFVVYYCLLRYLPQYLPNGKELRGIRTIACKYLLKKCGNNVNIKRMAFFGSGKNIEVGDNSDLGLNVHIAGIDSGGELYIGSNVIMAPEVKILTIGHNYGDITKPIKDQGFYRSKVIIEDDVWIGTRAIILPGVKIGSGAVIGAGAIVTCDLEPYSVNAGVPCRIIKWRK
jgi:maltose O-acetyltransferase